MQFKTIFTLLAVLAAVSVVHAADDAAGACSGDVCPIASQDATIAAASPAEPAATADAVAGASVEEQVSEDVHQRRVAPVRGGSNNYARRDHDDDRDDDEHSEPDYDDVSPPASRRGSVSSVIVIAPAQTGRRGSDVDSFGARRSSFSDASSSFSQGFVPRELFAMYNPHKKTCMAVLPGAFSERKLKTTRCDESSPVARNSRLTFHWKPAENNVAFLAWFDKRGREFCAVAEATGTRFYPCTDLSTKWSLSATDKQGRFSVKRADKASQCMDAEFHHALRLKPCGPFRDQKWRKLPAGFIN